MELPSIQQLENFITYARVKNFTLAAQKANITQSAFSFQMKKLEELVGIQLIARSNRGSDLTKAGREFLKRVQVIIDDLHDCMYYMEKLSGEDTTLNIGALMSLGDVLLNKHLTYFQQENKSIHLNIYNLESREMLRQLRDNQMDVISTFLLPQLDINEFEKIFFCDEKLVYFAPNLDIVSNNGIIDVTVPGEYPLVQYSPYYYMNAVIYNFFCEHAVMPEVEAWLSTPYAMINYCQHNKVGGILSERLLNEMHIQTGYYEMKPSFILKCYLLYKKTNPKYRAMKLFIDHIINFYNDKK